jgi:ABC-type dipeptide/oligopeptide/nickel transport system permease subunit
MGLMAAAIGGWFDFTLSRLLDALISIEPAVRPRRRRGVRQLE